MHYFTKVIQLAGEECVHYSVLQKKQTICGIKLEGVQSRLEYKLDETKLCEECRDKSPVPRLKDWCPRYQIKNGDQAKTALSILRLYFESLGEQSQLSWGIHEYFYYQKKCKTTNILVNPHPIILGVKEEKKVLEVSLIGGEGRVEEELPFKLIEEFMPLIKKDYLEHLQQTSKN